MISHDHHGHGHGHLHSHSHSPSRHPQHPANTPKTLRQERSNGSLHGHSHSEPNHEHTHSHSHVREPSPSRYLPSPPYSNGLAPRPFESHAYESSPALSHLGTSEPSLNALEIVPKGHEHHDHSHAHHTKSVEPRSRFTSFLLPIVLRWPLLHTIMSEKDSRRIFYFMRQAPML